jgi:hypothetical protein
MRALVPRLLFPLLRPPRAHYHVLHLLENKYEEDQMKLAPALFHLYLHKLQVAPFSERFLIVLAVDCHRTSQPLQRLEEIVNFALGNLEKFESRITLVVLLSQMHLYKYSNRTVIDRFVRRAFELEERQDSGYTFYNLKLLILIHELVGLDHYSEALYRRIDFTKFKPLAIAMVLELFYEKKLEAAYPFTDELVDMFVACESFVPFADVHHLSYAIRKINNAKFKYVLPHLESASTASGSASRRTSAGARRAARARASSTRATRTCCWSSGEASSQNTGLRADLLPSSL